MAKTSLGSRVLSVLLAASMVASLNAPVSAWAAGDDEANFGSQGETNEQK